MEYGLKALLGARVRIRDIERFSGSGGAYSLRTTDGPLSKPVSVARLLIRCGVTPTKAKGAVERLNEVGSTAVELPLAPSNIPELLAPMGIEVALL
jgi:hypothetical protein